MKLTERDTKLFYKLNWAVLHYVNQKHGVINILKSANFAEQSLEKVDKLFKIIFSQPDLIDRFVEENPDGLSAEELKIVKGWKNFRTGRYIVMKHTRTHSAFMEIGKETKVYGVVGLHSEISEVAGPNVPVMVETSLLPFKGRIVYCGFMFSGNVLFGSGIKSSFQDGYRESVAKYGVITSLDVPVQKLRNSDEELVRFYSASEASRAQYATELKALLKAHPELVSVHYQEIGKSNSRRLARRLSTIGVESAWFAVLEDSVIASSETEDEARERAERLIPEGRKGHIYVFRHRKKPIAGRRASR
ncbi:MAG: hypothetical protein Q7J68_06610 [Thermoplasmata archaeon]|nr:hypothetical protein [Thermoplasmata archaeon]